MKPLSWIIGGAIFAFWGVMMTLLVQSNLNNGNAPFSELPPPLVLRQIFKNEVSSQLGIYEGVNRLGSVTITPLNNPQSAISFDGNLALPDETGIKRVLAFGLELQVQPDTFAVRQVTLRLRRRNPELNVTIIASLEKKMLHYEIKSGGLDLGSQDLPLTPEAFSAAVPLLAGMPLPATSPDQMLHSLQIRTNRASTVIREERMDVFRLRVEAGELQATATLGQLGEVFMIRTSTNYSLLADGLDPAKQLSQK